MSRGKIIPPPLSERGGGIVDEPTPVPRLAGGTRSDGRFLWFSMVVQQKGVAVGDIPFLRLKAADHRQK